MKTKTRGKAYRDDSTARELAEHLRLYGMRHIANVPQWQRALVRMMLRERKGVA